MPAVSARRLAGKCQTAHCAGRAGSRGDCQARHHRGRVPHRATAQREGRTGEDTEKRAVEWSYDPHGDYGRNDPTCQPGLSTLCKKSPPACPRHDSQPVIAREDGDKEKQNVVVSRSKLHAILNRNDQIMSGAAWLKLPPQHVPDCSEHLVRYYGWKSKRSRGERKTGESGQAGLISAINNSSLALNRSNFALSPTSARPDAERPLPTRSGHSRPN